MSHSLLKIWWIFICVLAHFDDLPANIDVSWFRLTKPTWSDGSQRASCGQGVRIWWIENAACVVWKALLRTIWPISHHLSHISSSSFSIQAGEKHPSWPMRRSPQMGKAAPHKVSRVHPWHLSPLGFITLSSSAKCFLEIKTGWVNEWPQKRILPLVFCRSHGLIHYTATGSEQRHLWAPLEVCIQIHTKKIQRQAFLLESTRAVCWRLVHKDMDPQLSSALLFKQHHWWDLLLFQRGKMAILSLLLLLCIYGEMISCKTFGTMSSQTVPVVPTWWVFLTFIHRNIGTIYLVFKFKSL